MKIYKTWELHWIAIELSWKMHWIWRMATQSYAAHMILNKFILCISYRSNPNCSSLINNKLHRRKSSHRQLTSRLLLTDTRNKRKIHPQKLQLHPYGCVLCACDLHYETSKMKRHDGSGYDRGIAARRQKQVQLTITTVIQFAVDFNRKFIIILNLRNDQFQWFTNGKWSNPTKHCERSKFVWNWLKSNDICRKIRGLFRFLYDIFMIISFHLQFCFRFDW